MIASILGAVVSPVLTAAIGRSSAKAAERENVARELPSQRNDQRIRTGDISGNANFHQTIDQRRYVTTSNHSSTSNTDNSGFFGLLLGAAVVTVVVGTATAKFGLSLLAALPWAPTLGAVVLVVMTLQQQRSGSRVPVTAPIVGVLLAGLCWVVAGFIGSNDNVRWAIAHVNEHGFKVAEPSAGLILWLFAATVFVALSGISIVPLTVGAQLRYSSPLESQHWTAPFIGKSGFRLGISTSVFCGVLLLAALALPALVRLLGQ
ncbi:hypothetical protein [Pseudarthrobacter sp. B4EP4b]|uniref:hypothetical protein n=1 Tax=Pseudarthrobacter sp. B4EP4b TaxID=2590664 RepID=UPI00115399EC|nr:hypothetical protein [Pseudarthrobacter sp. B4EP4b]